MKKVISILLAVLMMFSLVTVAFAEETTAPDVSEPTVEEEAPVVDLGEYDWILDLPFWTVGPALKFAKIALKLVNVYLKVAKIFGLVDKDLSDYIMDAIIGMIKDAESGNQTEAPEETTVPETTAPEVVLA